MDKLSQLSSILSFVFIRKFLRLDQISYQLLPNEFNECTRQKKVSENMTKRSELDKRSFYNIGH